MTRSPRVAAYCRISTLDQHADIQVEGIRRAARERGWNLVAEHVDAGVSGGRDRRPALDTLLEQVERHEVDVVVVARLDRLGRSLAHVLRLLDLFSKHGVQFVSLADAGLDGTTAVGRMTLQLCAVFAEFERSLLRERTLAGLAARRELDLRAAHVLLGQGHSLRAVATMFGLPRATLARRLAEAARGGVYHNRPSPRPRRTDQTCAAGTSDDSERGAGAAARQQKARATLSKAPPRAPKPGTFRLAGRVRGRGTCWPSSPGSGLGASPRPRLRCVAVGERILA
jgi:DNA invertase Pin-like site-specific DNA recombinase